MARHFDVEIADHGVSWSRREAAIVAEGSLDGIYVVRTSVPASEMDAPGVVGAYKTLAKVERVFRSMKTLDLDVRPAFQWSSERVRAHIFLCMLAYYVEWHMRKALWPLLFDDEHPEHAQAMRKSIVAPAQRSDGARKKAADKRNSDDLPVHDFQSLLRDLANLARNRVRTAGGGPALDLDTLPTPLQAKAFELLGVDSRM